MLTLKYLINDKQQGQISKMQMFHLLGAAGSKNNDTIMDSDRKLVLHEERFCSSAA